MNNFYVGQKVVCVDDSMRAAWRKTGWFSRWRRWTKIGHNLNRGDVYTIASLGVYYDKITRKKVVCARVLEAWHFNFERVGFPVEHFRPVKTTSIEVFEKLLAPTPRVNEPV